MSMDALIGQVLGDARRIAEDVMKRDGVRLRTATVTASSPVRIRYDGETEPSVVSPRSLAVVRAGDRVVVAKSRGQATVLGVLGQDALWTRPTMASGIGYPGHGYYLSVQRDGSRRYLRGRVSRTDGSSFEPGSSSAYEVATLAPDDRPTQTFGAVGTVTSFANPGFARVDVRESGKIYVAPSRSTGWVGLDGITWDIN